MFNGETSTVALPLWVSVIGAIGLLISLVGNIAQAIIGINKATRARDTETIAGYERLQAVTKGELGISVALVEKIKGELESVSEEYSTLVGLDIEQVLDFAREGMHVEIRRRGKVVEALKNRLSRYESDVNGSEDVKK